MQLSPSSEVNIFSVIREIMINSCSPKIYYHVYLIPLVVPTLNQTNQSTTSHAIYLRSILILFSIYAGLQSGLFPSDFPTIILLALIFSLKSATCPIHRILLDLVFLIIVGDEYKL
jgi:hypothetical protein